MFSVLTIKDNIAGDESIIISFPIKKNEKSIRKPKQTRSIETKNKILNTALELFCKKGFYLTTTNEIAKVAGVPIGSLYSYYKNKDIILLEILNDYNETFIKDVYSKLNDSINVMENMNVDNIKELMKSIISILINRHLETKELNIELKALCHTKPEVAEISKEQEDKIYSLILRELKNNNSLLNVHDYEACAMTIQDIINSTVDRIVFKENSIDNNRIINSAVNAICNLLH